MGRKTHAAHIAVQDSEGQELASADVTYETSDAMIELVSAPSSLKASAGDMARMRFDLTFPNGSPDHKNQVRISAL